MSKNSFIPKMAFAGGDLDHAETRRDVTALQEFIKHPKAKTLLFDEGKPAVGADGQLITLHPSKLVGKEIGAPGPIFLGLDRQRPVFAFTLAGAQDIAPAESFQSMRHVAPVLDAKSLALAGRAKSLFDWHLSHRFCSTCGAESHSTGGGMFRVCQACGTEHYPRVNPVAIMLVLNGESCLLGRSEGWPAGAYSALAGFVSPGETIEEGCIREVKEEVGLNVHSPTYVFSQPWPFPSQLMMGMVCYTDETKVKINPKELEDARWFTKDETRSVFAKESEAFLRPPSFTIAHQLLRFWLSD